MRYLYGNVLTHHGAASNNHGRGEGFISPLQKVLWQGETHSTVSADAIRWSLRFNWQKAGYPVNRVWDETLFDHKWQDPDFDPDRFIDDDVLGYMVAEAAVIEDTEEETEGRKPSGKKANGKGTKKARKGALEVSRAVSCVPFTGDITFNASSGKKGRTSLHAKEFHATRYQYGFAIAPEDLKVMTRILAVLDGLIGISKVGGSGNDFRYDFSPDSIILRWTEDPAPRFFYCFDCDEWGNISATRLLEKIESEDIDPEELWVGGRIAQELDVLGINKFLGIKATVKGFKEMLTRDLALNGGQLS